MRSNSRLIKFLATIMTAVIFITGTVGTEMFVNNVAAGTTRTFSEIKSMLDTKMTQSGYKPGGNPPSSYTSGSGSYGFMDMITRYLFGHGLASQGSNPYEFASNYTTNFTRIGNSLTISSGNLTESGLKNLFSQAKPGDVVTMDYTKYDGTDSRHTVMVYSVSSTGVVFYHGGSSKVYFGASTGSQPLWGTGGRTLTWSEMLGFLRKSDDGLTIYRSKYAIADDTTGPSITITSFSETTDGQLKIEYKITDNSGIKNFYIYYNNVKDYSNTSSSTSTSRTGTDYYDPGDNYNGTITVKIVATDNKGNSTTYTKNISFDNRPPDTTGPSITLSYSMTSDGQLRIDYQISDSAGIKKYEIYYNNALDYSNTSSSTSTSRTGTDYYDPGDNFNGTITVKIVATDNNNNANSYTKNITFDNRPTYGDFVYIINGSSVEIAEYRGSSGNITIPSSIDGMAVTSISEGAFRDRDSLESVVIPNSVTEIGRFAFRDCSNLSSITLPNNLQTIEQGLFGYCTSLESVIIPESVIEIGPNAFGESGIVEIIIPANVQIIGDSAFADCDFLQHIYFEGDGNITFEGTPTDLLNGSNASVKVHAVTGSLVHQLVIDMNRDAIFVPVQIATPTVAPTNVPTVAPGAIPPATGNTVDRSAAEAFVTRCYELVLGRSPDPTGLNNWVNSLVNNQNTGAHMAYGFFFSQEYINSNTSNEEFVTTLYNVFLDRAPDQGGLNDWVGQLEAGATREQIFAGVANSREFFALCNSYGITAGHYIQGIDNTRQQNVNAFVARLYSMCLGRVGDYDGQASWVRQLINHENSGAGVGYGFFFSQEFINRNLTNEEYVATLYRVFLGREPDQAGFNSWVSQLNGGADRLSIFRGFAHSQEYTNICSSYGIDRGSI